MLLKSLGKKEFLSSLPPFLSSTSLPSSAQPCYLAPPSLAPLALPPFTLLGQPSTEVGTPSLSRSRALSLSLWLTGSWSHAHVADILDPPVSGIPFLSPSPIG